MSGRSPTHAAAVPSREAAWGCAWSRLPAPCGGTVWFGFAVPLRQQIALCVLELSVVRVRMSRYNTGLHNAGLCLLDDVVHDGLEITLAPVDGQLAVRAGPLT